jgi:ubiquinone/menaquinone biosynthesis C-methylase UbiE
MPSQGFEAALREWLKEACQQGHPLAAGWVEEHLARVEFAQRCHLPLVREFTAIEGLRVLDLGCGTGGASVAFALAGAWALGLDRSTRILELAALRAAEDRAVLRLVQGDARTLPLRAGAFELCICDQVIEHVKDYRLLLAEIYRILRPGGLAVVAAPHRLALREGHTGLFFASWLPHHLTGAYADWRGRRMPGEAWDVWLESPWTIRRRLRDAGFVELRSPWRQPRRPLTEGGRTRRLLARIDLFVRLVRWGFRWRGFLLGTVIFLVMKPDTQPGMRTVGGCS